ncbi:hypothetical protein CAC42_7603 [Sphaceloma murrayae]|uniref:Uncharacterized protein n=1 Tax=Sphaceloma murrayae TaxID=2082308 RepID=A0A2K1QT21_9PEZI|nr:hypothetical protein CAC42_7603 [Sphaceloma murrayae]
MSLLYLPFHLRVPPPEYSARAGKLEPSQDQWFDQPAEQDHCRHLTTIEEVDEEDEFEDIAIMDEKGLLSNEYRPQARSQLRRRLCVQLFLCLAIGIFTIYTVVTHKMDTASQNLVHLQSHYKSLQSPQRPIQPSSSSSTSAQTPSNHPVSPDPTLPSVLTAALSSLPDNETYTRLLAPAPTDLIAHYVHLTLRLRTFTSLLPAYAALHNPAHASGPLHPRLNLARELTSLSQQRSRSVRSASTNASDSRDEMARTMADYGLFLALFDRLAGDLFPFLDAPARDVVRLYDDGWRSGRGVVLAVGTGQTAQKRDMLRRLVERGDVVEVEVVFDPSVPEVEREDLENAVREMKGGQGKGRGDVRFRSLGGRVKREWIRAGTFGPLAVLGTKFREVVVLDDLRGFDGLERALGQSGLIDGSEGRLRTRGESLEDQDVEEARLFRLSKEEDFIAILAAARIGGSDWMRDAALMQKLGVTQETFDRHIWRLALDMVGGEDLIVAG